MSIELKVPEIGESITEVEIGGWLKKTGEPVKKDEPIVTLESEKATVELPSPGAGTIGKVLKQKGDIAKVGETIAYLEENSAKPTPQSAPQDQSENRDPVPVSSPKGGEGPVEEARKDQEKNKTEPVEKKSEAKPPEKPKTESKPQSPEIKAEEDLASPRLSSTKLSQEKTRSERLREE